MAAPSPELRTVRRAVAQALAYLPEGSLVVVACSGGADSLALMAATAEVSAWSQRRALRDGAAIVRLRAGAVVVDHAMQLGSAQVAQVAAGQCRDLGADPVLVRQVDPTSAASSGGLEGRARELRYAALDGAADELGAAAVLLGHTMDDQAETVLLGLGRGSGSGALRGMAAVRGRYLRPLLGVRRTDTEAVCRQRGLLPHQDPTNSPDGPWRTAAGEPLRRAAVRFSALPALSQSLGHDVIPALARTAQQAQRDEDLLSSLARELFARAHRSHPQGLALDITELRNAHEALRSRALLYALHEVGAPAGGIAHRHLAALEVLLAARGRGPADLPGVRAWREDRNSPGRRNRAATYGTLVLSGDSSIRHT